MYEQSKGVRPVARKTHGPQDKMRTWAQNEDHVKSPFQPPSSPSPPRQEWPVVRNHQTANEKPCNESLRDGQPKKATLGESPDPQQSDSKKPPKTDCGRPVLQRSWSLTSSGPTSLNLDRYMFRQTRACPTALRETLGNPVRAGGQ